MSALNEKVIVGNVAGKARVLLVDDSEMARLSLAQVLELGGFEVVTAANVSDALELIASQPFDVLVSDLHMPGPGDGLTVVRPMRHSNSRAVTIIFSGYLEMKQAAAAILLQADEILRQAHGPRNSDQDYPRPAQARSLCSASRSA